MRALLPLASALALALMLGGCTDKDPATGDGSDGSDGADGADGADGLDGSDGADGTDGRDDVPLTLEADDVGYRRSISAELEVAGDATFDAESLSGSASYLLSSDGEPLCDGSITFEGTAYTGDCSDCDFAFDVTAEVADAGTTPDCTVDTTELFWDLPLLWRNSTYGEATRLLYWTTYEPSYYYYYYYDGYYEDSPGLAEGGVYTGAFGYSNAWDGGYGGYEIVAHDDSTDATVTVSGAALSWSAVRSVNGTQTLFGLDDWCDDYGYDYGDSGYGYGDDGGGSSGSALADTDSTETLPCTSGYGYGDSGYGYDDGYGGGETEPGGGSESPPPEEDDVEGPLVDIWTFEAEVGQQIWVTVDTIAADTAFDPQVYVTGPSECIVGSADDTFDCSYPPPSYQCPSLSFTADEAGTYRVVVRSLGSCVSDEGAYAVDVRTAG